MSSEWREVLDRRNRTSKTKRLYENDQPTNKYSWDGMVGTSLHYEEAGDWLEVDPRIIPSSEPGRDREMVKSHWRFLVRNGGWFAAEKQGVGIGFKLDRIAYLNIQTKDWQTIRTANYSTPTVTEIDHGNDLLANPLGKLTWSNLFPGVDFEIHISGDRLHEEIKVSQAARDVMPTPPYPAADTYLVMVYRVDWGQVPGLADDDGDIDYDIDFERQGRLYLKNHQDEIISALPAGKVWTEGHIEQEIPLRKRFIKVAGQHYLLVGAPVSALNALPEGTIIFDPDVDKQTAASGDDGERSGATGFSITGNNITAGVPSGVVNHLFARWIGVTIEGNIDVSYITVYEQSHSGTPQLDICGIDEDSPIAPTTYGEFDADPLTTASVEWDGAWDDGWNDSPSLNAIFQELVNSYTISNDAVMLQIRDTIGSGTAYNNCRSYDRSGNTWGLKLHIEYTEAGGGVDYPVFMSLSRVATMTGSGQAGALGSASLGRSAGVTDGGQGAASAITSLTRSAGMSPTRVMGVARTVSLSRTARVTDAGQAATLSGVTLNRDGNILASALATALAAAALVRQAGVAGASEASALADTSLSRQTGISGEGLASALASASLGRQAGIAPTGSAQALASALLDIFQGLSVSRSLDVAVSFVLDRLLGLSSWGLAVTEAASTLALALGIGESAVAAALADTSLARDGGVSSTGLAATLANASLSRQAALTDAGQASSLSGVSLAREGGLGVSGLATALALAMLSRSGGITQEGSAQALASVLTEIFKGISVERTKAVVAALALALALGIDENALASAAASMTLAREQVISLLAEVLVIVIALSVTVKQEHWPDIVAELEHWPSVIAKLTHESTGIVDIEII